MIIIIIMRVTLLTLIAETDLSENHDESRLIRFNSRSIL